MCAKNDLNSVALNMSTVRLQFEFLRPWIGLTLRFARGDKNNGKDHPLHLRRCLLHFHLFFFNYIICMLILIISLELENDLGMWK